MYMANWITKLDDFLRLSERQILKHAGKVTHEAAVARAELEYDRSDTCLILTQLCEINISDL